MFKLMRNTILLLNLYVIVQAQTENGDSNNGGIPNPTATVSQASNFVGVNREQIIEQATTARPTAEDLAINRQAFQSLPNHFGEIGPLLFDMMTNENALGQEFARVSKIITLYLDLNRYRNSLGAIFELAESLPFSERLGPLFASIADVRDPETQGTFGEAVEIIMNVLRDDEAITEIRKRITSPHQIQIPAF